MRTALLMMAFGVALASAGAVQLTAHHAFSAEFDKTKPITLEGVISGMDWVNPHSWIHIDVKKPDGTVENWMVEGSTPNSLFRRGITKSDLKLGLQVKMSGFQAKDGALRAAGGRIMLPDGRAVDFGGTGTDTSAFGGGAEGSAPAPAPAPAQPAR